MQRVDNFIQRKTLTYSLASFTMGFFSDTMLFQEQFFAAKNQMNLVCDISPLSKALCTNRISVKKRPNQYVFTTVRKLSGIV